VTKYRLVQVLEDVGTLVALVVLGWLAENMADIELLVDQPFLTALIALAIANGRREIRDWRERRKFKNEAIAVRLEPFE
jgi:hypothetical protein